jgi:hypothetical protein
LCDLKEAESVDFRKMTLDDRHILDKFGYICSDYMFSYIYMYDELYKLKIAENNGTVIIRSDMDTTCFYMPLGDIKQGIAAVLEYCGENSTSPVFSKIPEAYSGIFENHGFFVEEDRNSFDYIFKSSDFIGYEGKKFRNQRNNLSSYLRVSSPEFDERVELYIDKCKAFTSQYHNSPDKLGPTCKMLDSIDEFDLKGGVVMESGEVAAFCLYEKVSEDMVQSHVELTNNSHRGVHAYLVSELAKRMDGVYVNKEDDMGLSGLRRFKENYNPCTMLKKYKAFMI